MTATAELATSGARSLRPRTWLTLSSSVLASLGLVALLVGRWDELSTGITGAPALVVAAAAALQALALVSRSEAWHLRRARRPSNSARPNRR